MGQQSDWSNQKMVDLIYIHLSADFCHTWHSILCNICILFWPNTSGDKTIIPNEVTWQHGCMYYSIVNRAETGDGCRKMGWL